MENNGNDQNNKRSAIPKRPLKRMFDSVPDRYDLLNRLLTLRLDEAWRNRAADVCLSDDPNRVMDLCCGTGDLAVHLRKRAAGHVEILGVDYSAAMLAAARRKADRAEESHTIEFVEGDAASLVFPDSHFDAVGIAFAFRNLTWKNSLRQQALSEVGRVLRPGGSFVIVETSQPRNRFLRAGFHAYLKTAVAGLGGTISGHRGAYRYLAESARRFYNAAEVASMLEVAGFQMSSVSTLLGGIAAIHVAVKPKE